MLRGRCGINNERTQRRLFIIKSSLQVLVRQEAAKATEANDKNACFLQGSLIIPPPGELNGEYQGPDLSV